MYFETSCSILCSDTPLPDIFITEYLPSMEGDFAKLYIYCLFLSKHGKNATAEELSKKLNIEQEKIKEAFLYLESIGVLVRNDKGIIFTDIKDKEIKKLYRPKLSSTPEEAALSADRNKKRNSIVTDINNVFFQGLMSPSWYSDIDSWFNKYQFEEDVMFALFRHCYDHKALTKAYIIKVADNWLSKSIKNGLDLDRYFYEYQKMQDIRHKIVKKLKRHNPLTEYEEAYLEKWVMEYGYDFSIIEIALKRTTSISNPNFEYISRIINEWHDKGLKTCDEIAEYEKARRSKAHTSTPAKSAVPQKGNFEQRKYSDDYFDKFIKTVDKDKSDKKTED
jgi:DnaD/phage-associated family protein